ncbi:MAG: hypothetical protein DME26_01810 [Verrucomicrobia bacterium]|nr:MAG: hypothetical protein DME26_01810 [Verrucomicrobiota bacterium]
MKFQFTDPLWLLVLPVAFGWVGWLAWKTDVQISAWRRWSALAIRIVIVALVVLAVAGLQWLRPMEGMNVFFLLDRSDSIPSAQQEAARKYVNRAAKDKKKTDRAGVLVFGTEASLESTANTSIDLQKINAIVPTERTDIAGAIRLGTAAFPETGQKRLVLLSDGNENVGEALAAVLAARPLEVTIDVVPQGIERRNDVSVQKLTVPGKVKKGQTFETKIFVEADQAQNATVRLYRNEQPLGEQKVELAQGKNLFTFPQTLAEAGFYSYRVELDAPGDVLPQNNKATTFTSVAGDPRVLAISAEPAQDAQLVAALRTAKLEVKAAGLTGFPSTLAELQSYDAIFISNVAAGDLGEDSMKLLESAVRDFGVGLICVGGDQTYAAGGYRGTPLEATLPVNMELDSKKVLPNGALALVVHATEFPNGNQWARDTAFAALEALGPRDEMGVILWDGSERWLFELQKVGNKRELGRLIMGMNPGDMVAFEGPMRKAYEALKKSSANLKHMVVFSDGDPAAPPQKLVQDIVNDKITISTVMIGGHVTPETMTWMAEMGRGRFYDVRSPDQLPQIFIKEAAVILKSAIFEEPFKPQLVAPSEVVRGIGASEYPTLHGYVATTPKPRAELPLVSEKNDPLLAHWQYGLGRSVAFTSDAKGKWAREWLDWGKFRQFWSQIAQWSLRRVENADFTTEVSVDKGEGHLSVEAVDERGNYRNFLNLQAVIVSPKAERQTIRLDQTGPGRYDARFPTKEVGGYLLHLLDVKDGQPRGLQVIGASVDYSPEFNSPEPNLNLLERIAEAGGGKVLDPLNPSDNPFLHGRKKTFQPRDLWEWLLKLAVILFPLDVGVRRIQIDRDEWLRATRHLRRMLFFWRGEPRTPEADESLAALLTRRDQVRAKQTGPTIEPRPELFRPEEVETPPATEAAKAPGEPASTTSRLLEAKRRAQRREK